MQVALASAQAVADECETGNRRTALLSARTFGAGAAHGFREVADGSDVPALPAVDGANGVECGDVGEAGAVSRPSSSGSVGTPTTAAPTRAMATTPRSAPNAPPAGVARPRLVSGRQALRHASASPGPASAAIRSTANTYPWTPHPAMTPSARRET